MLDREAWIIRQPRGRRDVIQYLAQLRRAALRHGVDISRSGTDGAADAAAARVAATADANTAATDPDAAAADPAIAGAPGRNVERGRKAAAGHLHGEDGAGEGAAHPRRRLAGWPDQQPSWHLHDRRAGPPDRYRHARTAAIRRRRLFPGRPAGRRR